MPVQEKDPTIIKPRISWQPLQDLWRRMFTGKEPEHEVALDSAKRKFIFFIAKTLGALGFLGIIVKLVPISPHMDDSDFPQPFPTPGSTGRDENRCASSEQGMTLEDLKRLFHEIMSLPLPNSSTELHKTPVIVPLNESPTLASALGLGDFSVNFPDPNLYPNHPLLNSDRDGAFRNLASSLEANLSRLPHTIRQRCAQIAKIILDNFSLLMPGEYEKMVDAVVDKVINFYNAESALGKNVFVINTPTKNNPDSSGTIFNEKLLNHIPEENVITVSQALFVRLPLMKELAQNPTGDLTIVIPTDQMFSGNEITTLVNHIIDMYEIHSNSQEICGSLSIFIETGYITSLSSLIVMREVIKKVSESGLPIKFHMSGIERIETFIEVVNRNLLDGVPYDSIRDPILWVKGMIFRYEEYITSLGRHTNSAAPILMPKSTKIPGQLRYAFLVGDNLPIVPNPMTEEGIMFRRELFKMLGLPLSSS